MSKQVNVDVPQEELIRLQGQLETIQAQLESIVESAERGRRGDVRKEIDIEIAALQVFDVIHAKGCDISASGFGCKSDTPLRFLFRFEHKGVQHEKDCELIWSKLDKDDQVRMGFRFIEPN